MTTVNQWGKLAAVRYLIAMLLVVGTCATAFAQAPTDIQFYVPSSKVVCLYDSTDAGTHGQRDVLLNRVRPTLHRLGLQVELFDVSQGLPPDTTMRNARGIVTAFDDAAMVNAQAYVRWLGGWLREGKKLVIFNNFGAFQEADTKKWLATTEVNEIFRALGVSYQGDWTDNGADLRLVGSTDVLKRGFDVGKAAHYYLFSKVSKHVVGHAVVSRESKKGKQSYVVFTSPTGGMALTRYYEQVNGTENIDRKAFLQQALFSDRASSDRLLVLLDPRSSAGHGMLTQLRWVTKYGSLNADYVTLADAVHLRKEDLARYSTVVLASDGIDRLNNTTARAIERWVYRDGGGLVSLFPSYRSEWDKMMGITRRTGDPASRTGIKYGSGFYPGLEGMLVKDDGDLANPGPLVVTQAQPVSLRSDARVFAHAVDVDSPDVSREPLMWARRHGKGRVVVRNDYALSQKPMRGHVLQMIMHAQRIGVAPIANTSVYFVDDSPQPMWGAVNDPSKRLKTVYEKTASAEKLAGVEYQMTDTAFYRDVWWKEMMRISEKYKVKLTFVLIFSYDDNVDKNFSAAPFYHAGGEGVPLEMARQAISLGHEVGLHGFNHQSLVLKKENGEGGYTSKGWTSREAMVEGLRVARAEWERVFGEGQAPFTYIAPNNHIGRAGKEAVRIAFPEIRVMAAQYVRDGVIGGQEFGPDPDEPHFMDMPRVASEFYIGSHNNLVMHDAIMLSGVWTHFVHPDDVYDSERDGSMPWQTLALKQDEMFKHIRSSYPWMRSHTAREAYHELIRYSSGPFGTEVNGDTVTINHGGTVERPAHFFLRLDPTAKVYNVTNGRVTHTDGEYAYHFFEGYGGSTTVSIEFAEN